MDDCCDITIFAAEGIPGPPGPPGSNCTAASIAGLAAFPLDKCSVVELQMDNRHGHFQKVLTADYAAAVPLDTQGGIFVQSTVNPAYCWKRLYRGPAWAHWAGALPTAAPAINTEAWQSLNDVVHALGGGAVGFSRMYGGMSYEIGASTRNDPNVSPGNWVIPRPVSDGVALLVRDTTYLLFEDGAKIYCPIVRNAGIIGLYDMRTGGGVVGRGYIQGGGVDIFGGAISTVTSTGSMYECWQNILLRDFELSDVETYGIAMQFGRYVNLRLKNIHMHDIGAAGCDLKYRRNVPLVPAPGFDPTDPATHIYVPGPLGTPVQIDTVTIERHGQGPHNDAGLDIRGPVQLNNVAILDFSREGKANLGFRLNVGAYIPEDPESNDPYVEGFEWREPTTRSTINNLYVDGGDPSVTTTTGVQIWGLESVFGNITVKNCYQGYRTTVATTGYPSGERNSHVNIRVEGAWGSAFYVDQDGHSLVNPRVKGAADPFADKNGNLVAGQTIFVAPRKHNMRTKQTLAANPFATTINSGVVTVNQTAHGRVTTEPFTISGAAAVGGLTMNGVWCVDEVVSADQFKFIHSSMATSTVAAGGGAAVKMAGTQIITKNGVALVQDTDYTVNSQTQITLTAGVLLTDTIEIITPTHFAFNLFEPTAIIAGDQKYVTNIFNFGDVSAETGSTVLASPTLTDKLALHGSLVIGDYSVWDDPGTSAAKAIIGGNFIGDNVIPNGELVLGHAFSLTTGNILGQLSFYSSDATAGAGGRQVAIKAISDDPANSGDRAALGFFTGTGTQDGQVERWRMSSSGALVAGTAVPFTSALLQLESTTKAFMPPSMTTAQRDAIVNPQERMEIWNNETKKKNIYDGTAWRVVTMT